MWLLWLERLVGASFILAGSAKFLGLGENGAGVLAAMARANAGTGLGDISAWLAAHPQLALWATGTAMLASGAAQVLQWPLHRLAGIGQLVMIVCFVALLNRAFPAVFLDGFYVMALVPILLSPKEAKLG